MSLPALTGCIAAGAGGPAPCYSGDWIEGTGLPSGLATYALNFDGTNDYVSFGAANSASSNALQPSAGTYAFWVKRDNTAYAVTFGAGPTGGSSASNADYGPSIYVNWPPVSGGKIMFNLGTGTKYAYKITNATLTTGVWAHLAMSWAAAYSATTDHKVYINGVEQSGDLFAQSDTDTTGWSPVGDKANRRVVLGARTNSAYYFNGAIAQVGVWDSVLGASDITSLQTALPSAVASSDLVAYYDMSDGGGSSTLTDKTANGYDGTLTNMDVGTAC